jgi:sterol desaturase/sphingolipid hydroxylase (fatty acid hydroxylase superfamily)
MFESLASTRVLIFGAGLSFFLALEIIVPYRKSSVSKIGRWANNLGLTFFNTLLLQIVFAGAIVKTSLYVSSNELGVMNLVAAPGWVEVLLTVAFLDFMLYVWHLLNHEMPFLWRFHRVHHSDVNMDVSTATRFHVGELALSAVIKISLVFFLGATLQVVLLFESLLVLCAQFHHSSVRVPDWFENVFWILFVPPSMHRIHHSVVIKERNSNYGTIFSIWDRVLGTLISQVDQRRIRIGVGAYQKPQELGFFRLMVMPFTRPIR